MEGHSLEKKIGIETYSTKIPGIGGKLRTKIEDFIVEEISAQGTIIKSLILNQVHPKHDLNLKSLPSNYYTYNLILEKYNLETIIAIQKLAKFLNIPYKYIGYAGLKDKRAITVQQISISGANPELLQTFQSKGIYLNRISPGKLIKLGDLNGNHFKITVRNINESYDRLKQKIEQIKQKILSSYVPNYYGPQRFGIFRPISHKIGRVLLLEDFESALKIYLTAIFPEEKNAIRMLRMTLRDSWPHINMSFPKQFYYENKIIQYLKKKKLSYKQVYKRIFPFRFTLLFIHAYQSYLFNKLLSTRIKKANLPLDQAFEGDYVAILDQYSLPTRAIYEVNPNNQNSLNNAISKRKASVMFPLFGFDLDYSRNPLADYIAQLLDDENLDLSIFKSSTDSKLNLKVIYRPILFKPKEFTITMNEYSNAYQDINLKFIFSINKGCYATILLREFMKTTPLNY